MTAKVYTEGAKISRKKYGESLKAKGVERMIDEITEEETVKYMIEAPADLLISSLTLQKLYVAYRKKEEVMDNDPSRFFSFKNTKTGETETIDLKVVNIKGLILNRHGTLEDLADAVECNREYHPLIVAYTNAKKTFDREFRTEFGISLALDQKDEVIRLFSELYTSKDIMKILRFDYKMIVKEPELIRFYNVNKEEIEKRKKNYLTSSDKYKISSEAGRLESLNNLLIDLTLKYEDNSRLNRDDKALVFSREIRSILEQARKEVKGNEVKLTVDGRIDISATLHGNENIARTMRTLPVNAIVIGIVAAKSNLDPSVLIAQLATSYYKDLNGFNKNILGRESIMLPGDLIRGVDWNDMRDQNKKFLNEMKTLDIQDVEEITPIKETLKDRITRLKRSAQI